MRGSSHLCNLCIPNLEDVPHNLIALADDLHVSVLDPVVDHLDVVARTRVSDPLAARGSVLDARRDGLEDGLNVLPRRRGAARHDGGAEEGAFLAAGDAGADEEEALGLELLGAPIRVGKVAVTAVDDDVPGLEEGRNLRTDLVQVGNMRVPSDAGMPTWVVVEVFAMVLACMRASRDLLQLPRGREA
jgi:hypothetical protein